MNLFLQGLKDIINVNKHLIQLYATLKRSERDQIQGSREEME